MKKWWWDINFHLLIEKIFNSNIFLRLGQRGEEEDLGHLWCLHCCVSLKNSLNKTDFGKDVTGSTLSFLHVGAKMFSDH